MPYQQPCPPKCKCGKHHRTRRDRKAIGEGRRREFLRREAQQGSYPKTKVCSRCKKRKKSWPRDEAKFSYRKVTLKSGVVKLYPRPECKECEREIVRNRPKDRVKQYRRNSYQRMKQDPERHARHLAYQREWDTQRRRENGQAVGTPRYRTEEGKGGKLELEPFSLWLAQQVVALGMDQVLDLTGLDEKQIRRWTSKKDASGPVKSISVDAADRVFVALDEPDQMAVLYPIDNP